MGSRWNRLDVLDLFGTRAQEAQDQAQAAQQEATRQYLEAMERLSQRGIEANRENLERELAFMREQQGEQFKFLTTAQERELNALREAEDRARADVAPWREAGTGALGRLERRIQAGPGDYRASPGYANVLAEGLRTIERGTSGGAEKKALVAYSQDLASRDYDAFLNRYYASLVPEEHLSQIGESGARTMAGTTTQLGGQAGQAIGQYGQLGANAIGQYGQLGANAIGQVGADNVNLLYNTGQAGANALLQSGLTRASGYIDAYNARQSGVNNILNLAANVLGTYLTRGTSRIGRGQSGSSPTTIT